MIFATTSTWSLSLIALAVLWRRRPHALLDLWLMVTLCAWVGDIALGAVINGGRYDLGFYVGRINGLLATSVVLLMLLAETLALYRRLVVTNGRLALLVNHDGLTGLFNRRGFDARLREELSRAQRQQQVISLLMIDVDNFKKFNDTYGHLDGDECLREIAHVLARAIGRPGDAAARFGGEEFAVILPATPEAGASHVAERLRAAIAALAIPHQASAAGIVTVSIGVATLRPYAATRSEDVIALADRALYAAKAGGRNKIATAPAADFDLAAAAC
jgi:diguanylate cyclase (GGDEF)-like protein